MIVRPVMSGFTVPVDGALTIDAHTERVICSDARETTMPKKEEEVEGEEGEEGEEEEEEEEESGRNKSTGSKIDAYEGLLP